MPSLAKDKMTEMEIHDMVTAAIGDQWDRSNLHGVDLRRCLVPPEQVAAVNAGDETDTPVWLVLLEAPDTRLGYAIAYHEESKQFGLVQLTKEYAPCLIGLYGGFFNTLEAM